MIEIGIDLNDSGTPDIMVSLDTPVTARGQYVEFNIVAASGDSSIGDEIGFKGTDRTYAPATSDTQALFVTDLTLGAADTLTFEETDADGFTGALTVNLTPGTYTDMDGLAADIELQMENESALNGNGIDYAVTYDPVESRFVFREDGSTLDRLGILWSDNPDTGRTLGFYPADDVISYPSNHRMTQAYITIDDTSNKIAFEETDASGTTEILWATVPKGTYTDMAALAQAVETAMEYESLLNGTGADYTPAYDEVNHVFSIDGTGGAGFSFDLLWADAEADGASIGSILGFDSAQDTGGGPYVGDNDMVLMRVDSSNNGIDFEEFPVDGGDSRQVSISIPEGEYTDLDDVALAIQDALRRASPHRVDYAVEYDYASGSFTVKGGSPEINGFVLYWDTGASTENGADDLLGFSGDQITSFSRSDAPVVNITIDDTNDKVDFREILDSTDGDYVANLTASIEHGTYTSHEQLALAVERAMEETSLESGNRIDFAVSWDSYTQNFTIKEAGTRLDRLDLMWQTGEHAPALFGETTAAVPQGF